MLRAFSVLALGACALLAGDWSKPVDVLHELQPCVTYKAKLDGDLLVVQATIQPGWHTFAIDNEKRAAEKLAGKPSLGIDMPTQIKAVKGLEIVGPWYQTAPKDFSKPDIRWYSWGFEQQAVFAAKVRATGAGSGEIGIRGQACSDSTCKNIDVAVAVPLDKAGKPSGVTLKSLVATR